jgi:hypothetical protein
MHVGTQRLARVFDDVNWTFSTCRQSARRLLHCDHIHRKSERMHSNDELGLRRHRRLHGFCRAVVGGWIDIYEPRPQAFR